MYFAPCTMLTAVITRYIACTRRVPYLDVFIAIYASSNRTALFHDALYLTCASTSVSSRGAEIHSYSMYVLDGAIPSLYINGCRDSIFFLMAVIDIKSEVWFCHNIIWKLSQVEFACQDRISIIKWLL